MRNSTISSSITTVFARVNGSFVGANSVLRSFLGLAFMREFMGNWQEKSHSDSKYTTGHLAPSYLRMKPSLQIRQWLAIAAPACQLAPVAVCTARARNARG
jgi:hypothetical protein